MDTLVSEPTRPGRMRPWELTLLAVIALIPRLIHLNRPPHFDELYHVLAARSWAANGTLAVADGIYDRAAAFTVTIGGLFRLLGDSLVVARLPALLPGVLLVLVLGYGTSIHAGRTAGWIAALLLSVDPLAIELSQFVRFYSLQALLFLGGAFFLFTLAESGPNRSTSWRLAALGAAIFCLAGALYFQTTTLIGLIGLGLWVGWRLARWWWTAGRFRPLWRWAPVAGGALGVIAILVSSEVLGELWWRYTNTPLWNLSRAPRLTFYQGALSGHHPVLFGLFPAVVLVAWLRHRSLAAFCAVVFTTALVLHSFAASKSERYLFYAMPVFYAVSGVAVTALVPGLRGLIDQALAPALPGPGRKWARATLHWTICALVVGFAGFNTLSATWRLVRSGPATPPFGGPKWDRAVPALGPLADSAGVVVSTALTKSLYFLGRGDLTLSASQLGEIGGRRGAPAEFAIDRRTGRPVISARESLQGLIGCHRAGLVIIEQGSWRSIHGVTEPAAAYLERHTEQVTLPEQSGLRAYRWQHPPAWEPAPCPVPVRDRP